MIEFTVLLCRRSTSSFIEVVIEAKSPTKAATMALEQLPGWMWLSAESAQCGKNNMRKEAIAARRRRDKGIADD